MTSTWLLCTMADHGKFWAQNMQAHTKDQDMYLFVCSEGVRLGGDAGWGGGFQVLGVGDGWCG